MILPVKSNLMLLHSYIIHVSWFRRPNVSSAQITKLIFTHIQVWLIQLVTANRLVFTVFIQNTLEIRKVSYSTKKIIAILHNNSWYSITIIWEAEMITESSSSDKTERLVLRSTMKMQQIIRLWMHLHSVENNVIAPICTFLPGFLLFRGWVVATVLLFLTGINVLIFRLKIPTWTCENLQRSFFLHQMSVI